MVWQALHRFFLLNSRQKKCNNIPRSKIMTPQTFVKVRRTMLDRWHVANWQTVTGFRSWTVTDYGDPLRIRYIGQPSPLIAFTRDVVSAAGWTFVGGGCWSLTWFCGSGNSSVHVAPRGTQGPHSLSLQWSLSDSRYVKDWMLMRFKFLMW